MAIFILFFLLFYFRHISYVVSIKQFILIHEVQDGERGGGGRQPQNER